MNVFKIAIAAIALVATLAPVNAASPCKGLDETACTSKEIAGVKLCSWISYYTTTKLVAYCRKSNRKITKEQFEAIQARLNSATPAAERQPAN